MIANTCTGLSPNHGTMPVLRFLSGLPHGAVFGMATIVAERIAAPGKVSATVAAAIQGICVSNVFCVPLTSILAQYIGWSSAFFFIGLWGLISLLPVARFSPCCSSAHAGAACRPCRSAGKRVLHLPARRQEPDRRRSGGRRWRKRAERGEERRFFRRKGEKKLDRGGSGVLV